MLRNPIDRYLSEWSWVFKGSTWFSSQLRCNGRSPSEEHFRPCHQILEFATNGTNARGWHKVTLDKFINCPFNLAANRQTRMLADLKALGCYSHLTEWTHAFFAPTPDSVPPLSSQMALRISAKHQLLQTIWTFGLSEQLIYSQYLMQISLNLTFGMMLTAEKEQGGRPLYTSYALERRRRLSKDAIQAVTAVNQLDISTYNFAKRLFYTRLVNQLCSDGQLKPGSIKRILYTLWRNSGARISPQLTDILDRYKNLFRRTLIIHLKRRLLRQGSLPHGKSEKH